MNAIASIIYVLFVIGSIESTLSPPKDKINKKEKSKYETKKGPINLDVFQRRLVVEEPKIQDIIQESGLYSNDTGKRKFSGDVLGYITPWNSNGYEISKTFHGKFTMLSPVWLTLPFGEASFKLSTHDVQKKWLKEIISLNTKRHTVQVLPRVLFENWPPNKIIDLQSDVKKQSQLIKSLVTTAQNFNFNGYVLEMWNQFVFTGVDMQIVVSLIVTIAQELKKHDLHTVIAIPPLRPVKVQLFSREHFDALSPHVKAFSLMTYDYSTTQSPGPNSPLQWAKGCVEGLVPNSDDPRRSQILLGLNFYGYYYPVEGGGPILGSEYLRLLESYKGKIQWDDTNKEHLVELKLKPGNGYIFYPTLYSLQQRLDLAAELGTGISVWELGQGLNYFYDML